MVSGQAYRAELERIALQCFAFFIFYLQLLKQNTADFFRSTVSEQPEFLLQARYFRQIRFVEFDF